jgi:hypothetical protein
MIFFQINPSVAIEMHQLQTKFAQWDVLIPTPHTLCHSQVFICSLNTRSLSLHKNDVLFYCNLKASHILCLNETHFNPQILNMISFIDPKKNSSINLYARNGTMVIYDKFKTLSSHETFTILGVEFITSTFNTNTKKVIQVIAMYKSSTSLFSTFINQLQKLLDVMPTYCPTIIMGDFNIDMFDQNSTQPNEIKFFYETILNETSV